MTKAYSCDVCGKPTSRLFGFAAVILLNEEDDDVGPLTRFRSSVRGYCAAHREQIPSRFLKDAESEGAVGWQVDEPAELRPAEVDDFLSAMDHMALEAGALAGGTPQALSMELHAASSGETQLANPDRTLRMRKSDPARQPGSASSVVPQV